MNPIPYQPSFEVREDDEAQSQHDLMESMHKISATVHEDEGHAFRSVHAKGHGLLRAELQVLDGLAPELAQGAFAQARRYPAIVRFSTPPGDLLDDKVSTPRGMAIKVVGVEGERVEGSEDHVTQDFLMVNGPVSNAPGPKKFSKNLKLLAATTDKAPNAKRALSATLRGLETVIEAVGGKSATLTSMGGHPLTNLLGETFFTQVPVLYGPYMAKLSLAPVSPELLALKDAKLDVHDRPDAIRDAVVAHFARHGGEWELRVQLCTDIEKMPIEDASVEWPQEASPYRPVARLVAAPQNAWSEARVRAVDDGMSFSPWHALAAHRPIGAIMRVRKAVYEMAMRFRSERNPTPVREPANLDGFPD